MDQIELVSLKCPSCSARETKTWAEILEFLRQEGRLRRDAKPSWLAVVELWRLHSSDWHCDGCGQSGLDLTEWSSDDDWQDDFVRCEACKTEIPAERLEVFPDSKVCVQCQQASEAGDVGEATEADYCPRCGNLLEVVNSTGRSGSYHSRCGQCGYRS